MYLAVDVGNSSISIALVENQILKKINLELSQNFTLEYYEMLFRELFSDVKIEGCIISSVNIELNNILKYAVDEVFGISSVFLDVNSMNVGIKINAKNPDQVGADRIANVYAAIKLYETPAIVVDMGTATTFDIVGKNEDFIGGIIIPGIGTQLKSLYNNTSLLPEIKPKEIEKVIGTDTESCILSGVIRGHAAAVDGLLTECKKELGYKNIKIIGTGGYMELISKYMKHNFDYANINLTLEGIRLIYELNQK